MHRNDDVRNKMEQTSYDFLIIYKALINKYLDIGQWLESKCNVGSISKRRDHEQRLEVYTHIRVALQFFSSANDKWSSMR